ncbi:response regulator [Parvularcula sp. ZS-1/3]|uniref:Response regulator n=1 Tax=Parvularcula mediterranea TaxID=2732508 RepID=A0A7Y3W3U7_9PROT|nr:response regulator [Parvularcula mediterranea]NNU14813.1 response regulator [Parvularcula mediterranea]
MSKCLVIEDSERVREVLSDIVGKLGLDVETASSAAEGLETIAVDEPDVILLDWDLPKLGALDLLAGLADRGASRRPAVILLATENEPKQFALARAAGASHYVLKPYDLDTIAGALQGCGFEVKRAA